MRQWRGGFLRNLVLSTLNQARRYYRWIGFAVGDVHPTVQSCVVPVCALIIPGALLFDVGLSQNSRSFFVCPLPVLLARSCDVFAGLYTAGRNHIIS